MINNTPSDGEKLVEDVRAIGQKISALSSPQLWEDISMNKLLLIIGNGFSIDFISQIDKADKIDVRNLFRLGHTVRFPDSNTPGFLSHRHCPNLWLLGARPTQSNNECMSIIEEIITCSNMLFDYLHHSNLSTDKSRVKLLDPTRQSVYIKAYSELIAYLRHLFISYNNQISDDDLEIFLKNTDWGWKHFFVNASSKYETIKVITYNYDIWLERILNILKIEYSVGGLDETNKLVQIIKPHGSISFVPKSGKKDMFGINYTIDSGDTDIVTLSCTYNELEQYDKSFLIPPAGDSSRQQTNIWSKRLRELAISAIKDLSEADDVFFCGMSYWHVDRKELDELLINLNQSVNITLINPSLPKELNAVLVTLFEKYTVFTSSESLKEV